MAISSDAISLLFKIKGDSSEGKQALSEFASALGVSENGIKNLATALPIAGAAVTAVTAAVLGASAAVFQLTKNASEFGSEIFDATEKTGLAAETISAMKFAADQSGTSLEAVTAASSKFARVIGDAALGSEKAQAKLDRLGVTSKDLDTALGQALGTIAKLPPGIAQMTAAQDAFGKSGVELLPFIKSFDGDLAALTQRAKDLGVTISDDAARKSDEFGDTLDAVSAQAAGLGRTFAFEVMPMMTGALQSVSDFMARNKGAAAEWGTYLANTIRGVTAAFEVLGRVADNVFTTITLGFNKTSIGAPIWGLAIRTALDFAFAGLPTIIDNLERIGALMPAAIDSGPLKYSDKVALPGAAPEPYKGIFSKAGMEKRDKWDYEQEEKAREASKKAAEEAKKAREKAQKEQTAEAKRAAEQAEREAEDLIKELKRIEDQRLRDIRENLRQEIAEKAAANQAILARYDADLSQGIITEDEALKFRQKLLEDFTAFKIAKLNEEKEAFKGNAEETARIESDLRIANFEAEQQTEAFRKENAEHEKKRLEDGIALLQKEIEKHGELMRLEEERRKRQVELPAVPLPVPTLAAGGEDAFTGFETFLRTFAEGIGKYLEGVALIRNANGELEFSMKQVFTSLAEIGLNAFGQLAAGFGQLVSNWVLYGNAGEQGLRKMTASILANVAQTAATYALMCLAAAALATTVWGAALLGGTPAQFLQGAALFGAVAVGAAVAGRATAGDSFKKASSGNFGTASSGSRSGGGGGIFSSQSDMVDDQSINAAGGRGFSLPEQKVTVTFRDKSNWFSEMFAIEVSKAGRVRDIIRDVAAGV